MAAAPVATLYTTTLSEVARGLLADAAPPSSASAALNLYLADEARRAAHSRANRYHGPSAPVLPPANVALPLAPRSHNFDFMAPARRTAPSTFALCDERPPWQSAAGAGEVMAPLFAQLNRYEELLAECAEECLDTDEPESRRSDDGCADTADDCVDASTSSTVPREGGSTDSTASLRRKLVSMRARLPR